MLPMITTAQNRKNLMRMVATLDFIVGFFLLFGGLNLAYHIELGGLGINQVMGITYMIVGLMLFVSSLSIIRGWKVGFRPYIYVLFAVTNTGFLAQHLLGRHQALSKSDIIAWCGIVMVVTALISLQGLLRNKSSEMQSSDSSVKM